MDEQIALTDNTDVVVVGSQLSKTYNFIHDEYQLKYNCVTNNLEDHNIVINGQPKIIQDRHINTMFLKLNSKTDKGKAKGISKDFMTSFIFSDYIPEYNPFISFIERHLNVERNQYLIDELADCIETDTLHAKKYIKHWGCGMIASIFGSQSPLTLVLAGEKINTGKTEFFRRLLPDELKIYYAESSLDGGKDDDILMCKKLIIMDDEFGGKSKKDQKRFKGLTSRQNMAIRVPYGRTSTEMRRICSLAGTSNELELLSDPYGNRRILPVNVLSIDHQRYNKIDKAALFMAFYDLYKFGFHWKFKQKDIDQLNADSHLFQAINYEAELVNAFFEIPDNELFAERMTNTEIKDYIETRTKQRIFNTTKLGIELKKLGFKQAKSDSNRFYLVKLKKEPPSTPKPNSQPF